MAGKSRKPKTKSDNKSKKRKRKLTPRRKYERGGRIEAYTMGEAAGSKKWP